MEGGEQT